MSKFDQYQREARAGLSRWDRLSDTDIAALARRCDAAEVTDLIERMERLSREELMIPAWDGGSVDDLRQHQLYLGSILAAVDERHLSAIAAALALPSPMSRVMICRSLEKRGRVVAEPLLMAALDGEADETVRYFLTAAIKRLRDTE
jgi:hypothetical protein